jgi:hypothetical protein
LPRAGPVPADELYRFFHLFCYQWAFRPFFVLGPQPTLTREQLAGLGLDPFTFTGDAQLGWKLAFCECNLAIFNRLLEARVRAWRKRHVLARSCEALLQLADLILEFETPLTLSAIVRHADPGSG